MARAKGTTRRGGSSRGNEREFETIELPTTAPETEPDPEFEEVDLRTADASVHSTDEIEAARQELERRLILDASESAMAAESGTDAYGLENITGVGIAEKHVAGRPTGQRCVTVFVAAKSADTHVAEVARVPSTVRGVPTDVVATGEFHARPFRGLYRPAPGGSSVGHYRITAGTLGCLVRRGRLLFILSNNHVLANSNAANVGDPVLQPGPVDGGRVPQHVIARLAQFVPIVFGGAPNHVDCAIAQTNPELVNPALHVIGRVSGTPVTPSLNMSVKKSGRTTQFTRGRVTAVNVTIRVNYGTSGVATFVNQVLIQSVVPGAPFSQGGDSGSLIVTEPGSRPAALLFAGSVTHTIGNPIAAVLRALNVTIVS